MEEFVFYKTTVETAIKVLKAKQSGLQPHEHRLVGRLPAPLEHLLWMCVKISKMDTRHPKNALKAARWIGWILSQMELQGFWTNAQSRNLIRRDVRFEFDKPHQT